MRIDPKPFDRNAGLSGTEAASTETSSGTSKTRSGQVSAGGDSVSLSGMMDLIALASHVADTGRSERVSRIAAEYRSGSYKVDTHALGDALIARAFEE